MDEAVLSKQSRNEKLLGGNWVGTAANLGLWSVVLVRNGQKLQLPNEPPCPEVTGGRDRAGFSVLDQSHLRDAILAKMFWRWGG